MIIAVVGRRVDDPKGKAIRFPLETVPLVRERLLALFRERRATAVVGSAACGADLIAQDAARRLGLRRVMVLPYAESFFKERSVTDRPGDWGPLFDELIADARTGSDEIIELNESAENRASFDTFVRANDVILDRASALAAESPGEEVLAVIVWDGTSRGPTDITARFQETARHRGVETVSVSTLP